MTSEQLAESKEYGRRELQCSLIDMVLDLVYLGLMAFVAAIIIDRWLLTWPLMDNRWLRLAALYLITMAVHYAVSFPLSFYSGFLLEHKYGMSRQSFGRWLWRYAVAESVGRRFRFAHDCRAVRHHMVDGPVVVAGCRRGDVRGHRACWANSCRC